MRAIPFKNEDIKRLCLDTVAKGDAVDASGRPATRMWSVSELLNYWRARTMIAEDALATLTAKEQE